MTIIDIIRLKYPNIQNVTYWYTKQDGSPLDDPYDGLVWENTDIPMPSKADVTQWMQDALLTAQYTFAQNKIANQLIYSQLDAIDAKSIRPLRENDTQRLADLTAQAVALRAQLLPVS
jgi:hypothetical protein